MRKFYAILSSFLILFCCLSTSVMAEGTVYLGYCDGKIATAESGNVTGVTGTGATINIAICISSDMLTAYAGTRITAIRWGVPESATFPNAVTAWIRGEQTGENITQGTVSQVAAGWNEIALDAPLTITSEPQDLWVGVQYVQENTSKLSVISFAGESNARGCFVGKEGKFTDFSGKGWGSLSLEVKIEGDVLTRDLGFVSTNLETSVVRLGDPIVVQGTIKNYASAECSNPIIRYNVNDGAHEGSYKISGKLNYRDIKDFSFTIPTAGWADECTADITLTLLWSETQEDEAPYNNVAEISAEVVKNFPTRMMVCEEGTGAWCGWCPRGIVGLKYMTETYPDRFIGIAVHSGDTYSVTAYEDFIGTQITAFPQCVINRDGKERSPGAGTLEDYLKGMNSVAEATLSVEAQVTDDKLTMTSHACFMARHSGADFRVVFVVEEDSLKIKQTNYYAGGSEVMGGFENLSNPCLAYVDDVARGIYPTAKGYEGSVPAEIEKRVTYDYTYNTTMPTIVSLDKVRVVALLINTRTGEIIQGARTGYLGAQTAVGDVIDDGDRLAPAYDLQGRRADSNARGLLIRNGKKFVKK